jgi:hypothetical protein
MRLARGAEVSHAGKVIVQDITVRPEPPVAGQPATLSFQPRGKPAESELSFVPAQGETIVLGRTDAEGNLTWTPASAGEGEIRTRVDGVEFVLPITVLEARSILGWAVPWLIMAFLLVLLSRWASRFEKLKRQAEDAASGRVSDVDAASRPRV